MVGGGGGRFAISSDGYFSNCTGYHAHMFYYLKMLPKLAQKKKKIVSGELQDQTMLWSSGFNL